jgi:hypothetical protein
MKRNGRCPLLAGSGKRTENASKQPLRPGKRNPAEAGLWSIWCASLLMLIVERMVLFQIYRIKDYFSLARVYKTIFLLRKPPPFAGFCHYGNLLTVRICAQKGPA